MSDKNIFSPRKIVLARGYCLDDAIDLTHEETNLYLYRMTRNEKHLRFKPGMQPARFVVQQLKAKFVREALDAVVNEREKFALAFRAACHAVEVPGGEPLRPDGQFAEWKGGVKLASETWVDLIDETFGGEAVEEIGKIAWEMSKLKPGADGPFV